jgi:hypothetical protein
VSENTYDNFVYFQQAQEQRGGGGEQRR